MSPTSLSFSSFPARLSPSPTQKKRDPLHFGYSVPVTNSTVNASSPANTTQPQSSNGVLHMLLGYAIFGAIVSGIWAVTSVLDRRAKKAEALNAQKENANLIP